MQRDRRPELDMLDDKPREECGVCGVFGHAEAANFTYLGLYALQHRGQEAAGIAACQDGKVRLHKDEGLVADIFAKDVLELLPGMAAVGHVRYSTTGASHVRNAAPFVGHNPDGSWVAVAHNGNLVNTSEVREKLEARGVTFESSTDSEAIMHAIRLAEGPTFGDRVITGLTGMKGAFSLVIMGPNALVAARDPNGFRPLCLGKIGETTYTVASESCAFDLIGASYVRDIEPGEVLVIDASGLRSLRPFSAPRASMCVFELIYFSRPDSLVYGTPVHSVRKEMGRQLAWEAPAPGDVVVPVPDSSNVAALGYAEVSKIPYELGLIRNHYVGRTFIEPAQTIRDFGTKIKLNPVKAAVEGKRVVLIDDSIVRGTTLRKITKMLKEAGAKEIHVRISSPPHRHACYYGIDFPTRRELIAHEQSREEIRRYLGVESLEYISIEGLLKAVRSTNAEFCLACFDGRYPVPVPAGQAKHAMEAPAVARKEG